jgi:hypothetical protein
LLNAGWMLITWSLLLVTRRAQNLPDVLVVGTDPILSVLVAWVVKRLRPSVQVVHWCFDLYPEAPIAEGMLREGSLAARVLKGLTGTAYRACDLLADIGPCMRRILESYEPRGRQVTLVPWALSEPRGVTVPNTTARQELFGDAALGLLYAGNFGRAHSYEDLLELARSVRGESIHFCFGVRGNQAEELRAAVQPDDANISFASFAPEAVLEQRLGAADIHLASLHLNWTGIVVPSKFFGSLAAGRPVLFAGSPESAIAKWIVEHQVGWVLNRSTLPQVAKELRGLMTSKKELLALRQRCLDVYHAHFSKAHTMNRWDGELRTLLAAPDQAGSPGRATEGNDHAIHRSRRSTIVEALPAGT